MLDRCSCFRRRDLLADSRFESILRTSQRVSFYRVGVWQEHDAAIHMTAAPARSSDFSFGVLLWQVMQGLPLSRTAKVAQLHSCCHELRSRLWHGSRGHWLAWQQRASMGRPRNREVRQRTRLLMVVRRALCAPSNFQRPTNGREGSVPDVVSVPDVAGACFKVGGAVDCWTSCCR